MRKSIAGLSCFAVVIAVSMTIAGSPNAQPAAPAFDAFLAGITECRFTEDFGHFRSGVIDRFANPAWSKNPVVNKAATVTAPADLARFIDVEAAHVRSEDGGESTSVDIPAQGTFNGVALKSLLFVLGNENGIATVGVEFAAPRDQVVKAFGQAIKRGSARLKKNSDGIEMTVGFMKPPAAAIYCDQSN